MIAWAMDHSLPIRRELVPREQMEARGYAVQPGVRVVEVLHLDGPVEIPPWPAAYLPQGYELDAAAPVHDGAAEEAVGGFQPRAWDVEQRWMALDRELRGA